MHNHRAGTSFKRCRSYRRRIACCVGVAGDRVGRDAPNAGLPNDSVAAAVPGEPAVPVSRNFSFAVVLSVESTRSATVSRNAVGCVTAMFSVLQWLIGCADNFVFLSLPGRGAGDLDGGA
jgi:hypothetical protein